MNQSNEFHQKSEKKEAGDHKKIVFGAALFLLCLSLCMLLPHMMSGCDDQRRLGRPIREKQQETMVINEDRPSLTDKLQEARVLYNIHHLENHTVLKMTKEEKEEAVRAAVQELEAFLGKLKLRDTHIEGSNVEKVIIEPSMYADTSFAVYYVELEVDKGKMEVVLDVDEKVILRVRIVDYENLLLSEKYSRRVFFQMLMTYYPFEWNNTDFSLAAPEDYSDEELRGSYGEQHKSDADTFIYSYEWDGKPYEWGTYENMIFYIRISERKDIYYQVYMTDDVLEFN